MSWLNILIVSPLWGMLSAQLFIQACVFLVTFVFGLIGLVKSADKVPRSSNVAAVAASIGGVALFTLLLFVGAWIIDYLQLAPSLAATIVYWGSVAFAVAYIFPQLPTKVRNNWRDTTQEDPMLRRAFENSKNYQSTRPPEQTH
jgi:hypothetical protein